MLLLRLLEGNTLLRLRGQKQQEILNWTVAHKKTNTVIFFKNQNKLQIFCFEDVTAPKNIVFLYRRNES